MRAFRKRAGTGRYLPGLVVLMWLGAGVMAVAAGAGSDAAPFPRPLESYEDVVGSGLWTQLTSRAAAEPFNVLATAIFLFAILHTFFASWFLKRAHDYKHHLDALESRPDATETPEEHEKRDRLRFKSTLFHFLGEVEVVFGLWVVPLAVCIVAFKGWKPMVGYLNGVNYTEPIFVFVIMAIAASKPVLRVAEKCLAVFAAMGGSSPAAWWLSLLTVGPVLGSFITEPAAMTICALLLGQRFYRLKPSHALKYATLGLLFVNISVGGTLTHFAAPPVVMVAAKWDWNLMHMLTQFGGKAVVGILVANALTFAVFFRELRALGGGTRAPVRDDQPIPLPVTAVHVLAITWTVIVAHYPALVVFGLLFFLAYVAATARHQDAIALRSPMLVGFFLASLVVHGGCQQWWIAPVLGSLGKLPLFFASIGLTAFNDNAAITYLASLVPDLSPELKYAVVAGAVTGGGLTVIANAPNPAGQSLLQSHFGEGGIQPLKLLVAALPPTVIMALAFLLL